MPRTKSPLHACAARSHQAAAVDAAHCPVTPLHGQSSPRLCSGMVSMMCLSEETVVQEHGARRTVPSSPFCREPKVRDSTSEECGYAHRRAGGAAVGLTGSECCGGPSLRTAALSGDPQWARCGQEGCHQQGHSGGGPDGLDLLGLGSCCVAALPGLCRQVHVCITLLRVCRSSGLAWASSAQCDLVLQTQCCWRRST